MSISVEQSKDFTHAKEMDAKPSVAYSVEQGELAIASDQSTFIPDHRTANNKRGCAQLDDKILSKDNLRELQKRNATLAGGPPIPAWIYERMLNPA